MVCLNVSLGVCGSEVCLDGSLGVCGSEVRLDGIVVSSL